MKGGVRSGRSFSASRGIARSVSRSSSSFKSSNKFYKSSRSPFRNSGRTTYHHYRTKPMTEVDFIIGIIAFLIFLVLKLIGL